MNIEEYRDFCLAFPGTSESLPFGPDVLVFKVMNKMFALTDIESFEYINLKCDPDWALILREQYEEIKPGYHMNKQHWNSVYTNGSLEDDLIRELIVHSYELIVQSLTKKDQEKLKTLT
jgi:predicted DNA-binding protein (MmcQ/YjbR family)